MSSADDNFWSVVLGAGVVIPLGVVVAFLIWVPYHMIQEYRCRPKR
jgi:hypothetical protein